MASKYMSKKIASIIEITIIYLIFVVIAFKTYSKHKIVNIQQNWNQHKSNPLLIPVANVFGKKSSNMFTGIIGTITNNLFKKTKTYFYFIFGLFNKIFGQFGISINEIRNLTKPIRLFFKSATLMFYKELSKGMIGVTYSMNKIRNSMRRSVSGFYMTFQTLMTMNMSLQSMMNSPLIPISKQFLPALDWITSGLNIVSPTPPTYCFGENTILYTKKGPTYIQDLQLSDVLENNNYIISIHTFVNNHDMYNYNGIIVSGSHMVSENNSWIRISKSKYSYKVEYQKPYIYCLSTSKHLIQINNIDFSDFSESSDRILNHQINTIILKKLNNCNSKHIINTQYPTYIEHGIDGNIHIKINNYWNKVRNIKIGDTIHNKKVLGVIKVNPIYLNIYMYKGKYIFSGNVKIYENNVWLNVCDSIYSKIIYNYNESELFHVVVEDGILFIDDIIITDYIECHDVSVNNEIDNLVNNNII